MRLTPGSPLQVLLDTLPQQGEVVWIGIRPKKKQPVVSLSFVEAIADKKLRGDHYTGGGKRQVTLIQQEHIAAVRSIMKLIDISPGTLRRNIVVRGINLLALKHKKFFVGKVLLEYTGECHPCTRMEENLGAGGYNAMRGHGGITARILEGGMINVGDFVKIASKV